MADIPNQSDKNDQKPAPIKIQSADKKAETTRIDLAAAKPPPSIVDKEKLPPDADDYFKRSTMRIDVAPAAPGKKSDTTRLDAAEATKKQTAKLDPAAAAALSDDVFKSKTVPVGIPVAPPPAAPSPMRPKTIQMKRPGAVSGESIIVSPETTASATEQARKSETARIDLEAEDPNRPSTRPKTIRIKRPDGTSGKKALTITRPEDGQVVATGAIAPPVVQEAGAIGEEEGTDLLTGIAAIAALLVMGVLVYVLLAQTFLPDLGFPGRI
mgnify:CR=1 FL=1